MFKLYQRLYRAMRAYPFGQAEWPQIKREISRSLFYMTLGEMMLFFEVYPTKIFIDDVLQGDQPIRSALVLSLVVATGYFIHEAIWKRIDKYRFAGMWRNFGLINAIGVRHSLRLGSIWHIGHSTAEKESVVSRNHKKIDHLTDQVIFNVVPMSLRICMAIVICMTLDWRLAILAALSPFIYGMVSTYVEKKSYPLHEQFRESIKRVEMSETEASAHAIPVDEQGLVSRFADKHEQIMVDHADGEIERVKYWRRGLGYTVWTLAILRACYYPLAVLSYRSGVSLGSIVLSSGLMEGMWSRLSQFMDFQRGRREGIPALRELTEIIETVPAIKAVPGWEPPSDITGGITFHDVCLRYANTDQDALRDIAVSIEPGETVAIIGKTGAGKSSMARLILRLQDPTAGMVTIDGPRHGYNLALCDPEWLRRDVIGYVPQENVLFDMSIRDNIRVTFPYAQDTQVRQAAQAAQIDDFIESLPEGYDTMVGERGLKLSGGQRQRLALARALIKQPKILVLDEPTSALDAETQEAVKQTLHRLAADSSMTIIVIAHRLSTISMADRVIEMTNGEIADFDTIPHLMMRDGVYAHMLALENM